MEKAKRCSFFNKSVKLELKDKNPHKLIGLGAEWENFYLFAYVDKSFLKEEFLSKEQDLDLIYERVKKLNLKYVRVFYPNSETAKIKGELDFSSKIIQSLISQLEFCTKNDIDVCLVMRNLIAYGKDGKSDYTSCDAEDTINNVMANLDYLINVKGFNCIKYVTMLNEPSYYTKAHPDIISNEEYALLNEKLYKTLKASNLNIKYCANDCSSMDGQKFFFNLLKDNGDIFNNHDYTVEPDRENTHLADLAKIGVKYSDKYNKPYVINEYGWDNNTDTFCCDDMDTYYRGLFVARLLIAYLDTGVVGASVWTLFNYYYSNNKMNFGIFEYKDNNWKVRPQYYSLGLIFHYCDRGATVYPIEIDESGVIGVALNNPDGSWTYLVANDGDSEKSFTFINKYAKNLKFKRYTYQEGFLPKDDNMIQSDLIIKSFNKKLSDKIPPKTFRVYSTK